MGRGWRALPILAAMGLSSFVPVSIGAADRVERQVLATDARRIDALLHKNSAVLREIYANDYTLVTQTGAIRTKSDQLSELESGAIRYDHVDVRERSVRVYGDVAIIVSRDQTVITHAGRQVGGDLRFTRVYKRFGSNWRLIATHASAVTP